MAGASLILLLGLWQGKNGLALELVNTAVLDGQISRDLYGAEIAQVPPRILNQGAAESEATQQIEQGKVLYQAGQFAQAIAAWQQAVAIYQNQKEPLNQALVLSYLALAYQQVGQWSEATRAIATGLELLQKQPQPNHDQQLILAQTFNAQGSLQLAQGQPEAALKTWQQATALYTQVGDTTRKIGSLINQAKAQQALGLFVRSQQTLIEVESLLQQQPNSQLKVMGLRSLGNAQLSVGNIKDAQRALLQSLALAQQLRLAEEESATLLSLGNANRTQNDTSAALAFYRQVATRDSLPLIQVQAQLNQMSLLLDRGQKADARSLVPTLQKRLTQLPKSSRHLCSDQFCPKSNPVRGHRFLHSECSRNSCPCGSTGSYPGRSTVRSL